MFVRSLGLDVRVSPSVPPGSMLVLGTTGWVRHMAELTPPLLGTHWHSRPERCPTWTDGAGCVVEGLS